MKYCHSRPRVLLGSSTKLWHRLRKASQCGTLLVAALTLAGCPLNPSVTVSNTPNQVGGTLHVSGTGFTANGLVDISATNTPGHPAVELINKSKADSKGSISTDIPFYWPAPQNLPGCAQGSTSKVTVTITAADETTSSPAFTTISLANCGMKWNEVGIPRVR